MFASTGIMGQQSLQRPKASVEMKTSCLEGDADNSVQFTTDFTVCLWYYGITGQSSNYVIGRETSSSNRTIEVFVSHNTTSTAFNFVTCANGSTLQSLSVSVPANLSYNKWYFLAMVGTTSPSNRKDAYIYDQSGLVGSGTTTTYSGMFTANNISYQVGNVRDASGFGVYNQRQNAHGVWNVAKTAAQIRELWNYGRGKQYNDLLPAEKTNLQVYWNLSDWAGTNCIDSVSGEALVRNTLFGSNISSVSVTP